MAWLIPSPDRVGLLHARGAHGHLDDDGQPLLLSPRDVGVESSREALVDLRAARPTWCGPRVVIVGEPFVTRLDGGHRHEDLHRITRVGTATEAGPDRANHVVVDAQADAQERTERRLLALPYCIGLGEHAG